MATWIKEGIVYFQTGHFSDYVVVHDESIKMERRRLYIGFIIPVENICIQPQIEKKKS